MPSRPLLPVPRAAPALPPPAAGRVEALRAFNRRYTQRLGGLRAGLPDSPFSLPQSRLLRELAQGRDRAATALAHTLDLDLGYVSRLLRGLREQGLVRSRRAAHDGRQQALMLTAAGRRAFAPLERASRAQMSALLAPLGEAEQAALVDAAETVQRLLDGPSEKAGTAAGTVVTLRPHRAGDIGWIVMRHGALYAQEYGWGARFEALVARIGAGFIEHFDPAREACWIAERDGQALGSVCLVRARDAVGRPRRGVAQLQLLLVEPAARGLGVGRRLIAASDEFARAAGYRRIVLQTHSVLGAARHLCERAGYRCTASEPHHRFGIALVGETWERALHRR
ncbi:MAG: helix-turn-helix domain-containing GNAT family N-acetyltransferase [Rubrivivax sp.]